MFIVSIIVRLDKFSIIVAVFSYLTLGMPFRRI